MSSKINKYKVIVFLPLGMALLLFVACSSNRKSIPSHETISIGSKVNLQHFNHLFTEINVGKRKMGVVNIYSEYPDYTYEIEPAEGFACVDDAARAIVMLSHYLKVQHDDKVLQKLKLLIEFVLYMQNDNGYFNNFIWQDLSINTRYKTSVAEINWWSFRALWSLQIAFELVHADLNLTNRIKKAVDKVVVNIKRDIPLTSLTTEVVNTIEIPAWLPNKYAADQAAVAIIALLPYYQRSDDNQVLEIISVLAKGIIQMQKGDANNYPFGMFLSWKNLWHSWGNNQAYALLLAGQQLDRQEYIQRALLEVDNFYPYLLKSGLAESISITYEGGFYSEFQKKRFPQIAYGIRPMVYATAQAYKITKNKKYLTQLIKLKSWFSGENMAAKVMYEQNNGRAYDAINSATEINMNSGAESTIEALLSLQK